MTWDNFDGSKRVHLDIKPEDRPFNRVKVGKDIADYVSDIYEKHQWGYARIIAHAKHNGGPTLTPDQVLSVLVPEKE